MSLIEIRAVLDAHAQPQILIGQGQRVEVVNTAARQFFDPAVEGRHYITALRQPSLLDAVEQCLATGITQEARYLGRDISQEDTFLAQVSACERPSPRGPVRGVLITLVDRSLIENLGQMRRDFVANVSHELRTPLTAITGFIETLEGPAANDAKAQARFLGMMRAEADRMNRLVADLLSLSRVESEARLRPNQTVDVVEAVQTARESLSRTAQTHDATVDVVDFPQEAVVRGDHDQMLQLFSNLMENAIKYGGGEVRITAEINDHEPALRGPSVRVSIADNGEGIDPLNIPRLTERFYRIDSDRSREKGGTGLGLAIVKHIVGRHRGRLQISSEIGRGSTFSVVLPLVAPQS